MTIGASPERITAVDSMGITGTWLVWRDAAGRQVRREKIEPGAPARKDGEGLELSGSPPVTAPAPDFRRGQ